MTKILLVLSLIISITSLAQTKFAANSRADFYTLQNEFVNNKGVPTERMLREYPINQLNGQYYVSVLCKVSSDFSKEALNEKGILFGSQINTIVSLKLPVTNLSAALTIPGVLYLEMASKVNPHLDKAVKDTRADSVQKGLGLPQSFTGRNVLIGITDWGFDYSHPMFYDTAMNASRILAAWDQYKTSGPAPAGHSYGTEFSTPSQLATAQSDTSCVYSYATHGSHVAGICGGGGAGTKYRGVGFDANFLFTTILVDAASILDAYAWMYEKSVAEQKRLVINQSWGLHYIGTLDGNSLLSQAIDNYSDLGVVFCSSGGNNGDVKFHLKNEFANDTIKTQIAFDSYGSPTMWGQSISCWGEVGAAFSTSISVNSNASTILVQSPWYSTSSTPNYIDTFLVVGNDTIFYNISADNIHPLNSRPQMRLRVKCTNTALKIVLHSTAVSGVVHYWNVVELTNDVGNWGLPFVSLGTGYLAGDYNYGISEPACTKSVISIGAYSSEYYNTSGTVLLGGGIASFSSYGPTLDERIKPDITAPGVNVGSSISSYTDNSYTLLTSVNFNGRTYPFARFSGTSMSGPMVTGIVSLILEANNTLMPNQVKDIIIQTARTDTKTGVIPVEGSTRWGFGKIHAWNAVKLALTTQGLGLSEVEKTLNVVLYPNPACDRLMISHSSTSKIQNLHIVTIEGKSIEVNLMPDNSIDLSHFNEGLYYLSLRIDGQQVQRSFVKVNQ